MKKRNLGLTAAVGSYLLWGLLPVYWKQLSAVSAYEILSHRIIWSFFFMLMILSFMGRMVSFWEECKRLWADKSRGQTSVKVVHVMVMVLTVIIKPDTEITAVDA